MKKSIATILTLTMIASPVAMASTSIPINRAIQVGEVRKVSEDLQKQLMSSYLSIKDVKIDMSKMVKPELAKALVKDNKLIVTIKAEPETTSGTKLLYKIGSEQEGKEYKSISPKELDNNLQTYEIPVTLPSQVRIMATDVTGGKSAFEFKLATNNVGIYNSDKGTVASSDPIIYTGEGITTIVKQSEKTWVELFGENNNVTINDKENKTRTSKIDLEEGLYKVTVTKPNGDITFTTLLVVPTNPIKEQGTVVKSIQPIQGEIDLSTAIKGDSTGYVIKVNDTYYLPKGKIKLDGKNPVEVINATTGAISKVEILSNLNSIADIKVGNTQPSKFSDIKGHWAEEPIRRMIDKGVVKGNDDGTITPNNNVSSYEALALIGRTFEQLREVDTPYQINLEQVGDFPVEGWGTKEVTSILNTTGIQSIGEVDVDINMYLKKDATRGEILSYIANKIVQDMVSDYPEEKPFTDMTGHPMEENVRRMQYYKLINGYKTGEFKPDETITRAELITVIDRLINIK